MAICLPTPIILRARLAGARTCRWAISSAFGGIRKLRLPPTEPQRRLSQVVRADYVCCPPHLPVVHLHGPADQFCPGYFTNYAGPIEDPDNDVIDND